jgi:hypothetical protein
MGYSDRKWYIRDDNCVVIIGKPELHFFVSQVRKQPRMIKGTPMTFYDFDMGQLCLSTDFMDFSVSDAHEYLHHSWEVDAHLNEQKISMFVFLMVVLPKILAKTDSWCKEFRKSLTKKKKETTVNFI